jgi:DNA polymerase alpha subunit A
VRLLFLRLSPSLSYSPFSHRNRTLAGNRAERNEYILLHRFNETGFVVPDKIASWEKKAQIAKADKSAKNKGKGKDEQEPKVEVKREKFKGGLVFDPEKGLWDRYVLVMDYNSLYPSIIQEFDIDFSTIDWTADDVRLLSSPFLLSLLPELTFSRSTG